MTDDKQEEEKPKEPKWRAPKYPDNRAGRRKWEHDKQKEARKRAARG